MSYTKQNLVETLTQNICIVKFTKVDGEHRNMLCTLREDKLPEKKTTTRSKKPNDSILSVWDLEKNDWRAFKIDNVEQVSVQ
jgi:hypothetical protein